MKTIRVWLATALAAVFLNAAPLAAQDRSCNDGRGIFVTDLGFDRPVRTQRIDGGEMTFVPEPTIRGVRTGGPAEQKVREGDVLLAIDGHPIDSPAAARRYRTAGRGDTIRLTLRRAGETRSVTIKAAWVCVLLAPDAPVPPEAPNAPHAPDAPLPPSPMGELMPPAALGFVLDCNDCGSTEKDGVRQFRFRQPPTVAAVDTTSSAAANVRVGDRLTHVDGVLLTSDNGWSKLSAIRPGQAVRLTFNRVETYETVIVAGNAK